VNLVEWQVFIPAMQGIDNSALNMGALTLLNGDATFDIRRSIYMSSQLFFGEHFWL